ncbi:MAG: hypothetical protein D6798_18760 [Deltaproteobacteria bacterium]|nr:MAG: hypothetical protein D6798_18760 [Deltaproteobacteria bacterium]
MSAARPVSRVTRTLLPGACLLAGVVGCGHGGPAGDDTGGGSAPVVQVDSDGDGILDIHEGVGDADGDGTPDRLDVDADGDGVLDRLEAGDADPETLPRDADMDGLPDFQDTDSDGNCILDTLEGPAGEEPLRDGDGDGIPDLADMDDDDDGLTDLQEGIPGGCGAYDYDNDGLDDRVDPDSDNDGIDDAWEHGDTDGDEIQDSRDLDSDGDGMPDVDEGYADGSGLPRDTDGDGMYDHQDRDADGDGIEDGIEIGVTGSDPRDPDTDGDGVPDGGELYIGTDPTDAGSQIHGVYLELAPRTHTELEVDIGLTIQRADVAFLLDTTASMIDEAGALRAGFRSIVDRLSTTIPDIAFGFATFEDYPLESTGASTTGALPFRMQQQITTSVPLMEAALADVDSHAGGVGGDYPESGMEGLLQALTGVGYDMNCDTVYDEDQDVRPFDASPTDPFGGLGGEHNDESTLGGGDLGGMGFRARSLPVVIYATDDSLKDADHADDYRMAGGCFKDAGHRDVVAAAEELGAYLVGICSPGMHDCTPQMLELAMDTASLADLDGDGSVDDPLVFDWNTGSDDTTELLAGAVEDLVESISFSELAVTVDDPAGFVVDIQPEVVDVSGLTPGEDVVPFTLDLLGVLAPSEADQYRVVTIYAVGDDSIWVDEITVLIRVLLP